MTKIIHQPHDKLVKQFLQDKKVAIDLLKHHLYPPSVWQS